MSVKTEYITSDGFRFPEEQLEVAKKHELHIEYLKAVMNMESIIMSCLNTCFPDKGDAEDIQKKNDVYVIFRLIKTELSNME